MGAVLAVDLGTTGLKAAAFAEDGAVISEARRTRAVLFGPGETAEQDPDEEWALQKAVTLEVLANCTEPIDAVVVTHQRGTFAPCREDGEPIGNYIVWMDRRGVAECARLERVVGADAYYDRLLQPIQPYSGLSKMMWLEERSEPAPKYLPAQAVFASRLTSAEPACDPSSASFLAPWRLDAGVWDDDICAAAGVPTARLPRVLPSISVIGGVSARAATETGIPAGTPVVLGGADGQCGAIGAGGIRPGVVTVNVGTATGVQAFCATPLRHPGRVLNTAAHALPGVFEMEGHTQSAGATLDWLLRLLWHATDPGEMVAEARIVPVGADGILFLPMFNGLSAPVRDAGASGSIRGLRLRHSRGDIARAMFEGLAFEARWLLDSLRQATPPVERVVLIGGLSRSDWWAQLLSDVMGLPVARVETHDAALTGAACLARLALDQDWLSMLHERDAFEPRAAESSAYEAIYQSFVMAVMRGGERHE